MCVIRNSWCQYYAQSLYKSQGPAIGKHFIHPCNAAVSIITGKFNLFIRVMQNRSELNITGDAVVEVYIAYGVIHIIGVIVPSLLLGPTVIFLLLSNKHLRDPVSTLFVCIAALCMLGPMAYGLLMDIGLIADKSVFGECGTTGAETFWTLQFIFQSLLVTSIALLSIIHYITIKCHCRRSPIKTSTVLGIFLSLAVVLIVLSLSNYLPTSSHKVRGIVCDYPATEAPIFGILAALYATTVYTPSLVLVVIFSLLTYAIVRKNVIENVKAIQSVTRLARIMISVTVGIRLLGFIGILVLFTTFTPSSSSESYLHVLWGLIVFSQEFNYPIQLLLITVLHSTVRKTLAKKLQQCCYWNGNRVVPFESGTTSEPSTLV